MRAALADRAKKPPLTLAYNGRMPDDENHDSPAQLQAQLAAQLSAGQLLPAEQTCLALLAKRPHDSALWFQLGLVRLQLGRGPDAEQALTQALTLDASPAVYWSMLGAVCLTQQRWTDAIHAYQQAVARDPTDAMSWAILGAASWSQGQPEQAEQAYQRSVALRTGDAATVQNYIRILVERHGAAAALARFAATVGQHPRTAPAWLAAGDALLATAAQSTVHQEQALVAYQQALALAPHDRDLRYRALHALGSEAMVARAQGLVEQLVAAEPHSPAALAAIASLRKNQIRPDEALAALHALLRVQPSPPHHSNWLSLLHYRDDATPAHLLAEHRAWDQAHAAALLPPALPLAPPAAGQKLRLGFVSADFLRHPVGYMVLPILEKLDRQRCEVICYATDRRGMDDYTRRFQALSTKWDHLLDVSDEALAAQIRADGIDVLFDLSGHHGKRLLTFARKPARVQVTWFGYVGTTGLRAMDYLLADRFHVVPGEEPYYAERVLRMPHGYACYEPPPNAPEVGPLPAIDNGFITFGSFNNPLKISPQTVRSWSEVLRNVPRSRLLLKYRGYEQAPVRDRLRQVFAQGGVQPERIDFDHWSDSTAEVLAAYNRIDLALDTLPFSGGLTTCEALWMGVPVVACPGATFASRHATSHLMNTGLAPFVARDTAAFIESATHWSSHLEQLSILRQSLRNQLTHSPLTDAKTFADFFLETISKIGLEQREQRGQA